MSAAAHSQIARCLLEPGYLDRLLADQTGPIPVTGQPAELDLAKVRLFAGFISKVQHNDLWMDFPFTRALLKLAEVEIGIFAEYRNDQLRLTRAGPPSRAKRVRTFLDFLEERLSAGDIAGGSVIQAMTRHERALWEVSLQLSAAPEASCPGGGTCITARDALRVVDLGHEPAVIAAAVRGGGAAWATVPLTPHWVCYWGERAEQRLTAVEVDEVTAIVLDEVAAGIPCAELAGRAATRDARASAAVVDEVIEAAATRGMIHHTAHGPDQDRPR